MASFSSLLPLPKQIVNGVNSYLHERIEFETSQGDSDSDDDLGLSKLKKKYTVLSGQFLSVSTSDIRADSACSGANSGPPSRVPSSDNLQVNGDLSRPRSSITGSSSTPSKSDINGNTIATQPQASSSSNTLQSPKVYIHDPEKVELKWSRIRGAGTGLVNLGNTCFMNSVLQCLAYCPPLVTHLVEANHKSRCRLNGFCASCELQQHISRVFQGGGSFKPLNIQRNVRLIARHFHTGRQEDAHEFLRYLIDHMWKNAVSNYEILHYGRASAPNASNSRLDPRTKETTMINHIFGGYMQSQVVCAVCKDASNTYDHFMDFILDIKNASSLQQAMEKYIQPDVLRQDNAYKCARCKKLVTARKQFTVFRPPNVASIQLKRFDYNKFFGGKISKHIKFPETFNMRPYMSESRGNPVIYKLFGVVVHLGHSTNSGHYFCFVRAANGVWHMADDARVHPVNLNYVMQQNAYLLFYIRNSPGPPSTISNLSQPTQPQTVNNSNTNQSSTTNTSTSSSMNNIQPKSSNATNTSSASSSSSGQSSSGSGISLSSQKTSNATTVSSLVPPMQNVSLTQGNVFSNSNTKNKPAIQAKVIPVSTSTSKGQPQPITSLPKISNVNATKSMTSNDSMDRKSSHDSNSMDVDHDSESIATTSSTSQLSDLPPGVKLSKSQKKRLKQKRKKQQAMLKNNQILASLEIKANGSDMIDVEESLSHSATPTVETSAAATQEASDKPTSRQENGAIKHWTEKSTKRDSTDSESSADEEEQQRPHQTEHTSASSSSVCGLNKTTALGSSALETPFAEVKTWDGAVSQLSSSASSGLMGMNGSANGRKRDQYNDLLDFGKVKKQKNKEEKKTQQQKFVPPSQLAGPTRPAQAGSSSCDTSGGSMARNSAAFHAFYANSSNPVSKSPSSPIATNALPAAQSQRSASGSSNGTTTTCGSGSGGSCTSSAGGTAHLSATRALTASNSPLLMGRKSQSQYSRMFKPHKNRQHNANDKDKYTNVQQATFASSRNHIGRDLKSIVKPKHKQGSVGKFFSNAHKQQYINKTNQSEQRHDTVNATTTSINPSADSTLRSRQEKK